jgi:hypothetical protein
MTCRIFAAATIMGSKELSRRKRWLDKQHEKRQQQQADMAKRLADAFARGINKGR